ncbi:conserved hypothetical protein [Perkinsus marinus ATCC 50983]|uniref:Glycerol-3-phosphate transporter n=1 Tax=Perkinsus marinus (strain ATCC 50983 / TXsc) TaxID=423536 RepID=C5LPT1_PERM5|nr:conserved hypothetical protein [Perkinsus marinus ATCC 50983]EER01249.1 conserved hypothetical protein [Perkinsus marinus ATCC 50983]|eukprot:XP_002768531.1 conserved hypothetical protein [Perkinsus marinus ATCC 50983]
MKEYYGYSTTFFGIMNTLFLVFYAIGMFFTGPLGDIYRPVRVYFLMAALCCVTQVIFGGMVDWATQSGWYYFYYVVWVVNAVFQSGCWPASVVIVGQYFLPKYYGTVFGIWSNNSNVGNILGAAMCTLMIGIFGVISDYCTSKCGDSCRAPPMFGFLVLAIVPIAMLRADRPSTLYLTLTVFACGFLVGSVANVLSSVVCADLGRKLPKKAVAQVSGIIDGVGAIGGALMQLVVTVIAQYSSWGYVFIVLPIALALSAIILAKLAYEETIHFVRQLSRSPRLSMASAGVL